MARASAAPPELAAALDRERRRVDERLEALLHGGPPRLLAAMRHAVLGGGKRLRPILCLWTHERIAGATSPVALECACALELVHTYSLIHDDLPCMDDDALRRGRPTVHVEFGEALAVLAGDALLNLAYETLVAAPWDDPTMALQAVRTLADAASHRQLVGGQVLDLEAEGEPPDAARVHAIHAAKTAALIRASMLLGGRAAAATGAQLQRLEAAGTSLGLAFQITDDVLDLTAVSDALGKTSGKDRVAGKMTWPAVHGVEAARRQAAGLVDDAVASLGDALRDERLVRLARYCVERLR